MAFAPLSDDRLGRVTAETVITGARLVLEDRVIDGTLVLRDGRIADLGEGRSRLASAVDWQGDHLLPGLIDLHTDNLERHFQPRYGVTWDGVSAAIAHDGQVAAAGITTVFDSLTIGAADGWDVRAEMIEPMLAGLAEANGHGMLRVDHRLHLRCEVTHPELVAIFEAHAARHAVAMISLMDHAPGDRQVPDVESSVERYTRVYAGDRARAQAQVEQLMAASRRFGPANRAALAALARERGIPLATHDDATVAHVAEAVAWGAVFTEFPTTLQAAVAARRAGLATLMGTPNLLRGGSHSGNVAAAELASRGLLDLLASDYIPLSLLKGAFRLSQPPFAMPLHEAVAMVTSRPARIAGIADRGRLARGLRGDLIRVELINGRPIIREVQVEGRRVA